MDLRSKEVTVLLVTKTLPNLGNGLKPLGRPLPKIVKSLVTLVGLQGVESGEFFWSWRTHVALYKQIEKTRSYEPIHWVSPETLSGRSSRGRL